MSEKEPGMADAAQHCHDLERMVRHQHAIAASDFQHLKDCLRSAADRFADVADLMEKDPNYRPVGFLRTSAERYRREAS
jgi:hypothetical protein